MRIKILILFASTAISVGLVDFLVRIFLPIYDPSGMVRFRYSSDYQIPLGIPDTTWRQWNNTGDFDVSIKINAHGLRDRKDLKNSGENDFFVVGDSYAFGFGVEEIERFSNQLESLTGRRFYNIAMPATDLKHYQRLVRYAESRGAHIGKLIVAVCMENDLLNYSSENESNQPVGEVHFSPFNMPELKIWMSLHSALYNLTTTAFHSNERATKYLTRLGLMADNFKVHGNFDYTGLIDKCVQQIVLLENHRQVTVLIIPSRALWVGNNRQNENCVHLLFIERLKQKGLAVVDLKPIFEHDARPLDYYFQKDPHWTKQAHAKAAEVLLAQENL